MAKQIKTYSDQDKYIRVQLELPASMRNALNDACQADAQTISGTIRRLITEYLWARQIG